MAKKAAPGDRGVTNLSETKDLVRDGVPKILNLKKQREAINEQISSVRKNIAAAGIPLKALDHAIRVREMDPQDRERFDEGYAIARDAIGVPQSRSLFDMLDTPAGEGGGEEGDQPVSPNGRGAALDAAKAHLGTAPAAPDAVGA